MFSKLLGVNQSKEEAGLAEKLVQFRKTGLISDSEYQILAKAAGNKEKKPSFDFLMSMECKALTVNSENPNNPIPTEGFYVVMNDPNDNGMIRHYIIDFEGKSREVYTGTIRKCLGVKDRAGHKLYEMDKVRFQDYDMNGNPFKNTGTIIFDKFEGRYRIVDFGESQESYYCTGSKSLNLYDAGFFHNAEKIK